MNGDGRAIERKAGSLSSSAGGEQLDVEGLLAQTFRLILILPGEITLKQCPNSA
jgi:hypothetical protein